MKYARWCVSNKPDGITNLVLVDTNHGRGIELILFSQYNICELFSRFLIFARFTIPIGGRFFPNEKCDDGIPSTEQEDDHAK